MAASSSQQANWSARLAVEYERVRQDSEGFTRSVEELNQLVQTFPSDYWAAAFADVNSFLRVQFDGRELHDRFPEYRPGARTPAQIQPTADEPPPPGATPYDVLANTPPPGERMPCGIKSLDKALRGGLARGRVYTLVGPPGMGKTALAIQIARTLARKHGAYVVGLFADEGAWAAAVMLAEGEGFDRDALENDFPAMPPEAHEALRSIPFLMPDPDDPAMHLDAIEKLLLDRAPIGAPLVVVVDSVQTVRLGQSVIAETRKDRADAVMSWARSLSRRRNVVVILTAKANRASWARKNPSENTDSLAAGLDSSSIEYDSDALFFLSGDPAEKTFLAVKKNRPGDGSKPTIALGFNRERATFHEIDQDVAEAQAEEAEREKREASWSKDEARVLDALRRWPDHSQAKLARMVRMQDATLAAILTELARKGKAVRSKVGTAYVWKRTTSSREGDES